MCVSVAFGNALHLFIPAVRVSLHLQCDGRKWGFVASLPVMFGSQ